MALVEYYYVTYLVCGQSAMGVNVLAQSLPPDGDSQHGFNFADATRFLTLKMGSPVIIQNWIKITRKRRDEFYQLLDELNAVAASTPERRLELVPHHTGESNDTKPPDGTS